MRLQFQSELGAAPTEVYSDVVPSAPLPALRLSVEVSSLAQFGKLAISRPPRVTWTWKCGVKFGGLGNKK